VLPRNRYVPLQLTNPAKAKQPLSPYQKPCKHMAEAIVVDGAERGHTVKVCAEPSCAVHFPRRSDKPTPEQLAKEREQRRRELEKRKLETAVRHRALAEVLKKVTSPMERGDIVLIASALIERAEPLRREALARRHKMVEGSPVQVTYPEVQKGLARLLRQSDEIGLSKLIVEIVLLGSVDAPSQEGTDALAASARQHRVDMAKVRSAVVAEFAAKEKKAAVKEKKTTKAASSAPRKAA
jgi:ParB family chromosome partitioning protein